MRDRARSRIAMLPPITSGAAIAEAHPRGTLEAAEQEGEDLAQVGPRQVHRHGKASGEKRADGVAGQQEARQRRKGPAAPEAVDHCHGRDRAGEGEHVEQPEVEERDADRDEHGDRRAEGGPGRRAQHVRIGQRVAEEPLERGACDRQAGTDNDRGEDARKPELGDDRLGGWRPRPLDRQAEGAEAGCRWCRPGAIGDAPGGDPEDDDRPQDDEPDDDQPAGRGPAAGRRARTLQSARLRPPIVIPYPPVAGAGGSGAAGLMASASARSPSTRRGPGRVTTTSSTGRIAPDFTAAMPSQPGRAATWSAVAP